MIKNIITSAVTALVVTIVLIGVGLVGGKQSVSLGGTTNYDSLGLSGTLSVTGATTIGGALSTGDITMTGTGTSTLVVAGTRSCIQIITTSGSTTAAYWTGTTTPVLTYSAGTCK